MDSEFIARPLESVETHMAADVTVVKEQTILALKRKLPEIENLPEWDKKKGNIPIAIVGGGPSLKYTVDELRNFPKIIACGGTHDWLVENNIQFDYCLVLDPDALCAWYLSKPQPTCTYLIASYCHPDVFNALEGYPVVRWHCAGLDMEWMVEQWQAAGIIDEDGKKPLIGGGCTCGLRAITMAMMLGYKNMHLFGLDSNRDFNDDAHHVYEYKDPVREDQGEPVVMHLGSAQTGRRFKRDKYMMAQLWGFKELVSKYGHYFDITVHGDSILYEFMRLRRLIKDNKELEKELEFHRAKDLIQIDIKNSPEKAVA